MCPCPNYGYRMNPNMAIVGNVVSYYRRPTSVKERIIKGCPLTRTPNFQLQINLTEHPPPSILLDKSRFCKYKVLSISASVGD